MDISECVIRDNTLLDLHNSSKDTQPHSLIVKGAGSRFSVCSLIKLLFSNLLLILSVNNPIHMYLSDLRVYFKFLKTESLYNAILAF